MTAPDPVEGLPLGARVVVRSRLADPAGGPSLTDAVGTLVSVDAGALVVDTRQGPVTIERSRVVAAKVVPPRPSRRGAPHLALSVEDLQRVMLEGWSPVERAGLGDWVLRAAGGFTGRANSVLPLGDPGLPLPEAVAQAEGWYAARGLPPRFLVAGPVGFAVAEDRLGALLLERGYRETNRSVVMTAAAQAVADASAGTGDVEVTEELSPRWLDAYARQREVVPGATEAVLTGSPGQLFASASAGGQVVAVARLGLVAGGWAGLYGVWVDPEHRGRGLARALTGALAAQAAARGTRSVYLQTLHANEPATRLYASLGFAPHHSYSYLDR
ncbi:GNAT family N-acetyltransferase [Oryzihumus sp.]|uniref:GNAT family N-acetyltransferase n=1 Tax=Oryzihumus sp. TaxID=1968903 RepID=UPI002ED7E426